MVDCKLREAHIVIFIALSWFAVNLLFLDTYPFVHTDEPWLSGLTLSMMDAGSPAATEDFFDLYPRHPHAIKILYHLLQIPFVLLFGYSLFAVRLLSLLAGTVSLLLFWRLLHNISPGNGGEGRNEAENRRSEFLRIFMLLLMAADIQFIYSSHFARQESLLLLLETAVLVLLTKNDLPPGKRGFFAGAVTGLAAGFHPNAFIIAWPAGLFLLVSIGLRKRTLKEGLLFLLSTGIFASVFVLLSFLFNASFISDYLAYGRPLGVLEPADIKWLRLPAFYKKLFFRIGGTYHTPPIMLQMLLFPLVLTIDFFRNRNSLPLAGFAGFSIAVALIGKYSQPSIVFLLPFFYLGIYGALLPAGNFMLKKLLLVIPVLLLAANIRFSLSDISRETESFQSFMGEIRDVVSADSTVVSNLYGEYVTGTGGQFYDWRNLAELRSAGISLDEYLKERSVEYVILSDELDFIYSRRPVWNVLYGNIAYWYPEMKELLKNDGTLIKEFSSPGYGMRIAAYRYREEWKVRIYRLDFSPGDS